MARFGLLAALCLSAGVAYGSAPREIYVNPVQVDLLPNAANATHVVIHGGVFFRAADGSYGKPECGYLYFACKAGQEAMCQMQWNEIRTAIGQKNCQGFGSMDTVSKATLRKEGTPLASPDTWELGLGVSPGVSVGNQCPVAVALACTVPAVVDMATPAPADMATGGGAPDLSSGGGGGGGGGKGGCSLGAGSAAASSGAGGLGALVVLLLGALRRRR